VQDNNDFAETAKRKSVKKGGSMEPFEPPGSPLALYFNHNPKKLTNKYTKKLGIFNYHSRLKKVLKQVGTLNHSKSLKTVVSLVCLACTSSRDSFK